MPSNVSCGIPNGISALSKDHENDQIVVIGTSWIAIVAVAWQMITGNSYTKTVFCFGLDLQFTSSIMSLTMIQLGL